MNDLLFHAVIGLLDKLDEVTEASIGIFQMAQIHGMTYSGPTYEAEYNLVRTLSGTDRPPKTPNPTKEEWDAAAASAFDDITPTEEERESLEDATDWDKWERDNCTGCIIDPGLDIWYMKECPIHGHNSSWKNVEADYGPSAREDCKGCTINPNDIVWFDSDCPVHSSLADGSPGPGIVHFGELESNAGLKLVDEEEWELRSGFVEAMATEREESDEFRELAEIDFARARFDSLRGHIRELATLEKEIVDQFRPSKEWLERMFKIEDECGGHISVGGLAADLGMLPENPEKVFLMMGSNGEPMGTMSNPTLDDLMYYMRADNSSVRLLSDREAMLADRCNSLDECPAEDPDIVECPMHPELGG